MSYLRTLGAFVYSAVVSILFFIGALFIYTRILVYASGFWQTLGCIFGLVMLLSWIAERGLQYCSIPFRYLWDRTFKTRIVTIIPAIIVGIWCVTAPFRIELHFSVGDWILSSVWMLCCLVFYFNLVMLPLANPHLGVNCLQKAG